MLFQSEAFQEDIYPDALSGEPSLPANDWFSGKDAPPCLLKMESVYQFGNGGQPTRAREFNPVHQSPTQVKSIPNLERKVSPQSETAPTQASTTMPPASEKSVSSVIRTSSEQKKSPTLEVRKEHEIQEAPEAEEQRIPEGIDKHPKDVVPALEVGGNLQIVSGPTVFPHPI